MSEVHRLTAAVLTISDRCATGTAEDQSGPVLVALLTAAGFAVAATAVVPDEAADISECLRAWADAGTATLICTTGGTGLAPRDVTPEATREALHREAPGIVEAMRAASLAHTPLAMLSRAVAGVRGQTLIINLPGSPKAVQECFAVVAPTLHHAVELVAGSAGQHQPT
jgi:molybdenum cofactor synthesis domain-containing protein